MAVRLGGKCPVSGQTCHHSDLVGCKKGLAPVVIAGRGWEEVVRSRREGTRAEPYSMGDTLLGAGGYLPHCPCSRTGLPAAPVPLHAPAGQWPAQLHQQLGVRAGTAPGGSSSSAPPPLAGPGRQPTWLPAATGVSREEGRRVGREAGVSAIS